MNSISPRHIYNFLNRKVVGQEEAKIAVSNAVFLHYVRFFQRIEKGVEVKSSNLLLMGPSGSGKTLLIREASKAISALTSYDIAPVLEVDCTGLTARGWEGDDFVDLLSSHVAKYKTNELGAASTIVFLDEIDKLCMPLFNKGGSDHNKATQYGLLKAIEGTEMALSKGNRKISTDKMLFVFAGNFAQIRHEKSKMAKPGMGFKSNIEPMITDYHKQLELGGMVTQMIGRISYVAELENLSKKELKQILEEQLLPEVESTWNFMEASTNLSSYKINKIVNTAFEKKTGARGLQGGLDDMLKSKLFDLTYRA